MVDHLLANFAESTERSERNSNKDVLGLDTINLGVLDVLSRVNVEELKVSLDVGVGLFEVLESLGDLFFETHAQEN